MYWKYKSLIICCGKLTFHVKLYIYKEKIDECSSIKNLKEMDKYLKSVYKKN